MSGNILVAVDESKNSLRAVQYVADTVRTDGQITLLSVLPDVTAACGLDGASLSPLFKANRQAFCSIEDKKRLAIEDFMAEARDILVKAGFSSENVRTRIRKKKSGIARDILKEAGDGKFDTIVMGRKGLSSVKDFLMGSVPSKVVNRAEKIAVILVN